MHSAAFAEDATGTAPEARLVDELRDDGDAVAALSVVALRNDAVIGHVLCSRGSVEGEPMLGLGPLGVLPRFQRRGVGQALMHAVLAAADALDEPGVALLGEPAYYRRFGFLPGESLGILPPDPSWGEYFQVRTRNAWDGVHRGRFRYAAAFDRI